MVAAGEAVVLHQRPPAMALVEAQGGAGVGARRQDSLWVRTCGEQRVQELSAHPLLLCVRVNRKLDDDEGAIKQGRALVHRER